jgi:hypothetical protein
MQFKISKSTQDSLKDEMFGDVQYEEELEADIDLRAYQEGRINQNQFARLIQRNKSQKYKDYLIKYLGEKTYYCFVILNILSKSDESYKIKK